MNYTRLTIKESKTGKLNRIHALRPLTPDNAKAVAVKLVEREGFEPSKLSRQIYSLLPLATREPLHLWRHIMPASKTVSSQIFT